jgi:hypothetical protein
MAKVHRMDLLNIKELNRTSGIQMVARVLTANDELVCEECRKLSKMTFTIDEALATMPIPNNCLNGNCRCGYAFDFLKK